MRLFYSPTSPYVRKVMATAIAVGADMTRTQLQDRDRLIDAAQQRPGLLLEDLHGHPRVMVLLLEQPLGGDEVCVGVVPTTDPVDRKPEGVGGEAFGVRHRRVSLWI